MLALWLGDLSIKQQSPLIQRASCFVEHNGVEPMTSCMPCKRSSQLS